MSEGTPAPQEQELPAPNEQETASAPAPEQEAPEQNEPPAQTYSAEYVADLRDEAAKHRIAARESSAALEAAQKRVTALEDEIRTERLAAVQRAYNLTDDDVQMFLSGITDRDEMETRAKRLAVPSALSAPSAVIPAEGRHTQVKPHAATAFAKALFTPSGN